MICGETYDTNLPFGQATNPNATPASPGGFIAVFDGEGNLLWSHHLFGSLAGRACAVTDVSIRVAEGLDIVTYCGVSTHDSVQIAGPPYPLYPVNAFLPSGQASGGATFQGSTTGQWDGFVGRVTGRAAFSNRVVFHSIVSGPEQDGLFGIAEIDANRFVVVGSTAMFTSATPAPGFGFPGIGPVQGQYFVGVAMVFDATNTALNQPLVLESVQVIGDIVSGSTEPTHTHARDVVVLRDWLPPSHGVVIVGSTDSATALSLLLATPPAFHGGTDGFLLADLDNTGALAPLAGRFVGGPGDDGLVGVQGWSEYPDYVATAGFRQALAPATHVDIAVESFFVDSRPPFDVASIRAGVIGGANDDRPAAMGPTNATSPANFNTGLLGDPAGGGIAVDERARADVVGQTLSSNFPLAGGGRSFNLGADAVRAAVDMLPAGVGRTDGTGMQGAFSLPVGFTGGTSPACAISPFGKVIGQTPPPLPRVLIDYMGPPPMAGVTGASVLVSRPTAWPGLNSVVLAGFQYGFPGVGLTSIPPILFGSGVEFYTTDNPVIYVAGLGVAHQAHVELLLPLPTPPVVGMPMTVQMFFYVPSTVPGGIPAGGSGPCPGVSDLTASPALWMNL